ncbi:zinc-binding dehydrogenase [Microbacterium sp. NIBRBAC000506063]|uniref:zinc-binding dehydrogenase n=1 Tax=Microbacterium sp. NIBRBAC000506063 TaxID=2734618 RepID=UPI001CB6FB6A|nr:zinc-binding dehydrogenase [Microbacterium sp. NIBRBAC000506063]
MRPLAAKADAEQLQDLLALAAEGRLTPVIERRYSFAEAQTALAHIDSGRVVGKIVVIAASDS